MRQTQRFRGSSIGNLTVQGETEVESLTATGNLPFKAKQ